MVPNAASCSDDFGYEIPQWRFRHPQADSINKSVSWYYCVMKQLEDIRPEAEKVRIDVASLTREYSYDLEPMAA